MKFKKFIKKIEKLGFTYSESSFYHKVSTDKVKEFAGVEIHGQELYFDCVRTIKMKKLEKLLKQLIKLASTNPKER